MEQAGRGGIGLDSTEEVAALVQWRLGRLPTSTIVQSLSLYISGLIAPEVHHTANGDGPLALKLSGAHGVPTATAATISAPASLPPLPYPENALEPVISGKTLGFHRDKHNRAYIEATNKLIVGTDLADQPLVQIVTATAGKPGRLTIFHNAAQAWNHDFYWHCLKPKGGDEPPAVLRTKMEAAFGSVDACKNELAKHAVAQFGSGWAWLVLDGVGLKVVTPTTRTLQSRKA